MKFKEEIFEVIRNANSVAVLTGAGVSAESGIKTFRDPDGLWAKFNPQELASVNGFLSNPELVWSWYQERRRVINATKPNPGHFALAKMQNMFPEFHLITQNVDRLHHQAGSENVIELHGNIIENRCQVCDTPYKDEIDLSTDKLPTCKSCGGHIRPCVVWFGEMLPIDAITAAENASSNCDVFFSIGTSAEVYPAANMPVIAKNAGAYLIEINPVTTPLTPYADLHINEPSGIGLPELLKSYEEYLRNKK